MVRADTNQGDGYRYLAHKKVQLHIAQLGVEIILVASSSVLLSILASHSCTEYCLVLK